MDKLAAFLEANQSVGQGIDRRQLLLAAATTAFGLRLTSPLQAQEEEGGQDPSSGLMHDKEMTDFLLKHEIFREWYAIAEAVEDLSLEENKEETTICVPPVQLTPEAIAALRRGYVEAGHLVSDDGSFTLRYDLDFPAVRGRVSFLRGHLDVQMLVSLERTVTLTIDGDDDVAGVRIYRERTTRVPFGISVIDATGRSIGTANSNSNNIATLDVRNIDYKPPLKVKFQPYVKPEETRGSGWRGVSPYDDETLG